MFEFLSLNQLEMKNPFSITEKNSFSLTLRYKFNKEVQQHMIKCYYIYNYKRFTNICQHFIT